jgi:hypothetical protein
MFGEGIIRKVVLDTHFVRADSRIVMTVDTRKVTTAPASVEDLYHAGVFFDKTRPLHDHVLGAADRMAVVTVLFGQFMISESRPTGYKQACKGAKRH